MQYRKQAFIIYSLQHGHSVVLIRWALRAFKAITAITAIIAWHRTAAILNTVVVVSLDLNVHLSRLGLSAVLSRLEIELCIDKI